MLMTLCLVVDSREWEDRRKDGLGSLGVSVLVGKISGLFLGCRTGK